MICVMNRKRWIFCLLLLGVINTRAQVSMTLQVPPTGVLVKNQLWNMLLVNTGNRGVLIRVSLVLLDEKTSQPVLTATSMPFLLNKGARQIQAKDLSPIQYTYSGAAFRSDQGPNGFLPAGSYQACYTVSSTEKGSVSLVENCIQVNVDPLSPPLLNTPADEARIYTPYPQFTWLPPTPLGLFSDLTYTFILVEVLPGQGKGDAIQQNIPVYSGGFIKNLYMNYPSSFRTLDTSRLYAWRIVAMNNGQAAAMSDIWTFRVAAVTGKLQKREEPFIDLKRGLDPSIASGGTTLKLSYENTPADTLIHYSITALNDPGNPIVQDGQLPLRNGRNLLEVPLLKKGRYEEQKVYLFKVVNSRNESWTVKFTWSPVSVERSLN